MRYIVIGEIPADRFPDYVERARRTLAEHAEGYEGVRAVGRYYAVGERTFFSVLDADSHEALLRVVTGYMDIADMRVVPVLDGPDAMAVWLDELAPAG